MSLYQKIQSLKAQIIDTEGLLQMVLDHPLMSIGLKERISSLRAELDKLPKISYEAKVQMLFSGNAVVGSQGIKSAFVSKIISPFQEMVKTQIGLVRFGNSSRQRRSKTSSELYLTALPTGSFGIELTQLNSNELFDTIDVSNAIKGVITIIANSAGSDETFESTLTETPRKSLNNLKRFLQQVSNENSILKIESGEVGIELSKEKVAEAFQRVSSTVDEDDEIFIEGTFRGLLLDSGKFEIQDESGKRISGYLGENLSEEELVNYDQSFLNQQCRIHLKIHRTKFLTGNEKLEYELLEIMAD